MPEWIGKTVGRVRIEKYLARGGMAEVYLGSHLNLDRPVAVKFLHSYIEQEPDLISRFAREAKVVAGLRHPNIVQIFDFDTIDGHPYIVMEYLRGPTLSAYLRRLHEQDERIPTHQVARLLKGLTSALDYAHSQGVVHRDIKPGNILLHSKTDEIPLDKPLDSDVEAIVTDFGLVRIMDAASQTASGMVSGTPAYMSPEQARGKETDARTDIWSLGVVLYEMLSGKVPFAGETLNHTIVSILEKELPPIENIPDELQRIIRKSLSKDKEMRYQTARDLLIDLKNLRRDLDLKGELERSIIPNREVKTAPAQENETQLYARESIAETSPEAEGKRTQNVTTASSLEYAVMQAKTHKLATALIGIVLLGVISVIAYFGFFDNRSTGVIDSIAVLPFENRSADTNTEYLSDGLTESLIYRLSQLPNLKVSPTSSVFRYKGKEDDPNIIAKELGVDSVMTGRITQRGDNLTISVELVDVRHNTLIWGEQYERKLSELLATQREIATEIAQKLRLKLSGNEKGLTKSYTDNNEAYQLYLKGRYHFAKRTKDDILRGIEYFRKAIELDPSFALAHVGVSESYKVMTFYGYLSPKEAFPQAKVMAQRAIEIDSTLAEAHAALANIAAFYERDWTRSEREFKLAIELNSNVSEIHFNYGYYLLQTGQLDEAIRELKQALEMEPLSIPIGAVLAGAYSNARQNDLALEQAQKIYNLEPGHPTIRFWLGSVYIANGMYAETIAFGEQALNRDPTNQDALYITGYAYGKSGQRNEAEEIIKKFKEIGKTQYVVSYYVASIYAALGDKDKSFAELEKAFAEGDSELPRLKVDPLMILLRNDPRFKDLLKRMNLPE